MSAQTKSDIPEKHPSALFPMIWHTISEKKLDVEKEPKDSSPIILTVPKYEYSTQNRAPHTNCNIWMIPMSAL